jgi:predicted Zn-dependent protease
MSKAQLAGLGLGVAAIASEEFRRYAGLAQVGMGLLFLKFGRDDERQADDLGLRYLARSGYDPREMPNVFRTLDRVSAAQGAGRIPNWLSTHPNPGDRVERLGQQIAALPPEGRQGTVNRDPFLRRLDGVAFGDNPREGFFKENAFYHPDLAFQLTFPAGWTTRNQKQAVVALAPQEDAAVVLVLASEGSADAAANAFFGQQGIERGNAWRRGFYHFRTVPEAGSQRQELSGIAGFFEHQGRVFQLRGLALESRWGSYRDAVAQSLGSFQRLADRRYLEVQPRRVQLVKLPSAMTLEEFARRSPSTVDLETGASANGVAA